jgi:hypothetical protein
MAQKNQLSKGELEVIVLLAKNLDIQEIALQIDATVDVVRKRLSEIYKKLEIEGKPGPGGKLKELKKILDQAQLESQRRQLDSISPIHGREADITDLNEWIEEEGCRILAILGIRGIGKTSLAATLFRELQKDSTFERFSWISPCPPFDQLLQQLLQQFEGRPREDEVEDASLRISKLLEYFRNYRCLVVLDQVDAVLKVEQTVGYYREGYTLYGELIKRLGEEFHKSCLIMTSSENLPEVESFEEPEVETTSRKKASIVKQKLPVRVKRLESLPSEAAMNIIQKYVAISKKDEATWLKLINRYQGNPLSIKIAAHFIREFLGGDVGTFLQQDALVFGDIAILVEQQIKRLSKVEVEVAELLSKESKGVSLIDLSQKSSLKRQEIMTALQSLKRRSLLDLTTNTDHQVLFAIHPLIGEYLKE